jgi:hypothetical protein
MTTRLERAYYFDSTSVDTRIRPNSLEFGVKRLYALMLTGTEDEAGSFHPNGAFVHVITPRPASHLRITTSRRNFRVGERVEVTVRYEGHPVPPHDVQILESPAGPYLDPWRRVRLDDAGRGHFAFRMPDVRELMVIGARIVDQGGDVVTSPRLLLGNRR